MESSEKTTVLDIPSEIQMLATVEAVVGDLSAAAGFDEDSRQDVQTAVHESVVNAMVHGNRRHEARRVRLEITVHPGRLDIRVQDEGRGFDPTVVPDPVAPENLSRSSGRGIFLMRSLMDEVTFRRLPGGGTEVRMQKRVPLVPDLASAPG
jgi:serine/threonine-protein kinase RsbW